MPFIRINKPILSYFFTSFYMVNITFLFDSWDPLCSLCFSLFQSSIHIMHLTPPPPPSFCASQFPFFHVQKLHFSFVLFSLAYPDSKLAIVLQKLEVFFYERQCLNSLSCRCLQLHFFTCISTIWTTFIILALEKFIVVLMYGIQVVLILLTPGFRKLIWNWITQWFSYMVCNYCCQMWTSFKLFKLELLMPESQLPPPDCFWNDHCQLIWLPLRFSFANCLLAQPFYFSIISSIASSLALSLPTVN